jgi:hypothetical protein
MFHQFQDDLNGHRLTHRDIGFFKNQNLDRTIISLRKSLNSTIIQQDINDRMPCISINEEGNAGPLKKHHKRSMTLTTNNFPIINQNHNSRNKSSSKKVGYLSQSSIISDEIVSKKKVLAHPIKEEVLTSQTRFLYNKIFNNRNDNSKSKKPKVIRFNSNIRLSKDPVIVGMKERHQTIDKNMINLRSKVMFIKSIYDYAYPKVLIDKLSTMKEMMKCSQEKRKENRNCSIESNGNGIKMPIKSNGFNMGQVRRGSLVALDRDTKYKLNFINNKSIYRTRQEKGSFGSSRISSNFTTPGNTSLANFSLVKSASVSNFRKY